MIKIKNSDNGVVGIITAVLLIGLIISVFSIVQLVFVPVWMEKMEADHMDTVSHQIAQLKFSIDMQSMVKERNLPVSTPITLGHKELPIMSSTRAFGNLEIIDDECSITIQNSSTSYVFPIGIIKYYSSNGYFMDQSFIYETGALITRQEEGNVMSVTPSLSVENLTYYNVSFSVVNISNVGGKNSISGYGTYPIRVEFFNNNTISILDVESILITTEYPESWENHFNKIFGEKHVTSNDVSTSVNFNGIGKTVNLYIDFLDIYAQIAPGWIE